MGEHLWSGLRGFNHFLVTRQFRFAALGGAFKHQVQDFYVDGL